MWHCLCHGYLIPLFVRIMWCLLLTFLFFSYYEMVTTLPWLLSFHNRKKWLFFVGFMMKMLTSFCQRPWVSSACYIWTVIALNVTSMSQIACHARKNKAWQTDRQTMNKVIPMWRYVSLVPQRLLLLYFCTYSGLFSPILCFAGATKSTLSVFLYTVRVVFDNPCCKKCNPLSLDLLVTGFIFLKQKSFNSAFGKHF